MTEVRELVAERGKEYGDSWKMHGLLLRPISHLVKWLLDSYPEVYFPWNLIFNKLLRVFGTPLKRDHWVDIQGYAQLVIDMIDKLEEEKPKTR